MGLGTNSPSGALHIQTGNNDVVVWKTGLSNCSTIGSFGAKNHVGNYGEMRFSYFANGSIYGGDINFWNLIGDSDRNTMTYSKKKHDHSL